MNQHNTPKVAKQLAGAAAPAKANAQASLNPIKACAIACLQATNANQKRVAVKRAVAAVVAQGLPAPLARDLMNNVRDFAETLDRWVSDAEGVRM